MAAHRPDPFRHLPLSQTHLVDDKETNVQSNNASYRRPFTTEQSIAQSLAPEVADFPLRLVSPQ
jgi:hypothetical protein